MLKTSWKVLGFLSFPLLFIFSFRVFRAYIFRSPSFTRKASFPQWHDTHLNFSLNRGNSVPPLSPLFFLPPFPSPPPPRFFHSPLPLFLVIPDPSGLSVAKSSFSPLPPPLLDLAPKQFNQSPSLFRVRPIGLSPAEAFLLFAHELAAIPASSSSSSWASCYSGNLNNPVHKPC